MFWDFFAPRQTKELFEETVPVREFEFEVQKILKNEREKDFGANLKKFFNARKSDVVLFAPNIPKEPIWSVPGSRGAESTGGGRGRLTRSTFPGCLTCDEFEVTRLGMIGRQGVGKSTSMNSFLGAFDLPLSQIESSVADGDRTADDVELDFGDGTTIVFKNTQGIGGETTQLEGRICEAILTNKIQQSAGNDLGSIPETDAEMPDQCHGAICVIGMNDVYCDVPESSKQIELNAPWRGAMDRVGIAPITVVTKIKNAENMKQLMTQVPGIFGSAEPHCFGIENSLQTSSRDEESKTLSLQLPVVIAVLEALVQSEQRTYHQELTNSRHENPDSKYMILVFLRRVSDQYGWPSHRLEEIETNIYNAWRRLGVAARRQKYITKANLEEIIADPNARVFRTDIQKAQVKRELAEFDWQ